MRGGALKIVTDKLASYSAAQETLIPSVEYSTIQYENNRCEFSQQSTRQRELHIDDSIHRGKPNGF